MLCALCFVGFLYPSFFSALRVYIPDPNNFYYCSLEARKGIRRKCFGTAYIDTVYVIELNTEIGSMTRQGADIFPTLDASYSSNLRLRKDSLATYTGLTFNFPYI